MADRWPLVGRAAEFAYLRALVDDRRGVVLAGAAGVGKSRLLQELVASLDGDRWHVERATGTPTAAAYPLGAFAFLDEPAGRDETLLDSPLAAARRELLNRAHDAKLVLAVDDAQHLDDASATLVHQLAVSRDAVVLTTVRSLERAPDAVVALWKDEHCERVELQPLARGELDVLLEEVLGGEVEPDTKESFWSASQGNLLFLRELIRDGLRHGTLRADGSWRWDRPVDPPPSVRELIGRTLRDIGEVERRVIELVALAEPLDWPLLTRLVPVATCDALLDNGDLEIARDGQRLVVRLSHPLIGDVVRAQIPEPRRRRLLAELVATLPQPGHRRADLLRRVSWSVDADAPVDTRDLIDAARSVMMLDPNAAERFATLARERGAGAEAVIALAQNLMFSRRASETEALLAGAMPEARDEDDVIALTTMRANNLTFGLASPEAALSLFDEMDARLADDPKRQNPVRSQRLAALLFAGRVEELLRAAEEYLSDPDSAPSDRLRAVIAVVPALALTGRPDSAVERADSARQMIPGTERDLPYALGQLAAGAILALHWSGRLDEADAIARLGYDEGNRLGARLLRGVSAFHLGVGAYWRGAVELAERYLAEAVAVLRGTDVGFLASACDHLRAARALRGVPAHDESDAIVAADVRLPLYETERLRLEAVREAAAGDLPLACRLDQAAADAAERCGASMQWLFASWDHARHGDAAVVSAAMTSVAAECEGRLAPLMARAAIALAATDAAALEDCSTEFEGLGFVLWAAELSRAAARAHGAAGLRARAAGADARADALLQRCEGARTPLAARATDDTVTLTRREREIATLAARGISNADIAVRLSISVRTVETHLQHAYNKLGVNTRHALRPALGLDPTTT